MITKITNSFTPLLTTVGFGGIVGFLIGIALRYIIKIFAVIAGIFFSRSSIFTITRNVECKLGQITDIIPASSIKCYKQFKFDWNRT